MTSSLQTKIEALATKINNRISSLSNKITTHEEKTSSNLQKGHARAGGTPQAIGTSLSAGTDNGYYARADHIHTIEYSNILNKPENSIMLDANGNLIIGTDIKTILINSNKNTVKQNETAIITVTAYDENNNIVENEPIKVYQGNNLIGLFNTNNNGQIIYMYIGNGAGQQTFFAKNTLIQSQTITINDTN